MPNATISGWGKCLPPAVLSNHDLEQLVDTSDDWITTRTGIKERRISHVEVSDLAVVAGQHALAAAGRTPADLDLIVLATCTGDSLIPSTASILQAKLEAWNAAAFDLNAACSGFVYALVVGANMIRAGTHRTVLVVGAEKLHFHIDFTDRSTCVLFGDGAGAVVLESTGDDVGLLSSELGMDGSAASILHVRRDGTSGDRDYPKPEESRFEMDGPELFRRAVVRMGEASARVIEDAGLTLDQVDLLIPHQANVRIIDATARRLGLDSGKVFVNIGSYGNTSAATIPVALTEALEQGRIRPGDHLVFTAFGAGLSWGAAVLRWGDRVEPIASSDAELPPNTRSTMELLEPNLAFFGRKYPAGDRVGDMDETEPADLPGESFSVTGVALVTGGSRGIGRAIAIALGSEAEAVAVNYSTRADAAEEVVSEIRSAGGKAEAFAADVSDGAQVEDLFARVGEALGPVSVLVNNAGITADNLVLRMSGEEFDRVIDTNLRSAFFCTKSALKGMIRARWGRIISISSVAGIAGNSGQANYAASKAGLIGFSKSVAKEVGSRGVTVNVVAPGFIDTDMTGSLSEDVKTGLLSSISLGRFGEPAEVAATVAFLASERASYVTGQVIVVDGGMAL